MVPTWGNDLRADPLSTNSGIHHPSRAIIQGFFLRRLFSSTSSSDLFGYLACGKLVEVQDSLTGCGKDMIASTHLCLPNH